MTTVTISVQDLDILHCGDGTANKVYVIDHMNKITAYGRVGKPLKIEKTDKDTAKLMASKIKKGYTHVSAKLVGLEDGLVVPADMVTKPAEPVEVAEAEPAKPAIDFKALEQLSIAQSADVLCEGEAYGSGVWVPLSELAGRGDDDTLVLTFYEQRSEYLWYNTDVYNDVMHKLRVAGVEVPFRDALKNNGWNSGAHRLWAVTRDGEVAVACFGEWKGISAEWASDGFPRTKNGKVPFSIGSGEWLEGKNYDGSTWEQMGIDLMIDPEDFTDDVVEGHADDVITSSRRDSVIYMMPDWFSGAVADAIPDPMEDFDYDAFCKENAIPDEILPTEEFVEKLGDWELVPDGETNWLFDVKKQHRKQLYTRETFEQIVKVLADGGSGDLDVHDTIIAVPEDAEWAEDIIKQLHAQLETA
jgi:hypothetical protein